MNDQTPPGWELRRGGRDYPACLTECADPPAVLRGFGDPSLLRPALAVVGSRRATPYGLSCAHTFAAWAAQRGVVIVSGAAAGCDQAAHRGALEAGGRSVAVLGCGADVDYPRSASGILATMRREGAVVAEAAWGASPVPYAFPRRNRIIAALASVVLVVEAGLPSGTFSTADHALDAGREVAAVPGSILSAGSRGCNRLIRQGASVITDISDLADCLAGAGLLSGDGDRPVATSLAQTSGLDALARRVESALLADPLRPDDVARALGADIVSVARSLSLLESKGVVRRYPDGRYGGTLRG